VNGNTNTALVAAFVVVAVLFLVFGGGAMTGTMAGGGMMGGGWMGNGSMGGTSWMWIPTLLTLVLGVVLGWAIFAKKA
jgi:hypothetical protein